MLPSFDVGVYSNLYPNRRVIAGRLGWLWRAQTAKPGDIFIAPVEALVQRTLPYEVLWAIAAEQGLRDSLGGMEYQHEVELLIKDAAVT